MKQIFTVLTAFLLITSCSSVKKGQKAINKGNYSEAIGIAIDKLQKDKSKEEYVLILQDAFRRKTETDKKRIAFLEKEGNPANSAEIFRLYSELERIQNSIAPLLPLNVNERKEAKFSFTDYSNAVIRAKTAFAENLYAEAGALMERNDKLSYRRAHAVLSELQRIYPGFRNSEQLKEEAHYYGTDFVLVEVKNQTSSVIPRRLEEELLNFNTYGLNDFWTEYHAFPNEEYQYDFAVDLNFREILVSPERLLEKEIPMEAEVLESYSYKKDRRGEFVRDSLGNKIKIENYITVKGTLYKTVQTKSLALHGQVNYLDLKSRQLLKDFPLDTEFVFENVFARFKGDERVLTGEDKLLLRNTYLPFPSSEQMLVDASEDIKGQLIPILKRYKLR